MGGMTENRLTPHLLPPSLDGHYSPLTTSKLLSSAPGYFLPEDNPCENIALADLPTGRGEEKRRETLVAVATAEVLGLFHSLLAQAKPGRSEHCGRAESTAEPPGAVVAEPERR